MGVTTPHDMAQEIIRRSRMLDEAIEELKLASVRAPTAEHVYRQAKAESYLKSEGTIPERDAHVIQETADLRYEAKKAEALRRSALEAVRARRAQLSAAQSVSNAIKAEIELVKTGPG